MSQAITIQTDNQGALRAKGAARFLGISISTFWRWTAQGKIPPGIRLSTRCTVWRRESLEKVLEQAAEGGK
ncbi:helix-turn-helix domain-containing protein [Desulfovibrio sp. OttesenSCG-928-A18]|nr:helix-turn-helix domain-containing protein [Desulfovibrio sp. OttesenSCG-928-A18]